MQIDGADTVAPSPDLPIGPAGSDAARRIAGIDWRRHPLGQPDGWPAALRLTLANMLSSPESTHLVWGEDQTFFFNDAYIAGLGPRVETAMGMRFDRIWPDSWTAVREPFERALAGEPSRFTDLHVPMVRGGVLQDTWWTFSFAPAHDDDGAVAGVLCVRADTTDQVRRQRALAESEARFRALAEALPGHVWSTDDEGAINWVNGRTFDYLERPRCDGTSPETIAAMRDAIHIDDLARMRSYWDEARVAAQPYTSEFRMRRPGGEYRWHLSHAVPLLDERGTVTRWVGTHTDIHDQRAARDALTDQAAALARRVEEEVRERDRIWSSTLELMGTAGFDGYLKTVNPAWSRKLGWSDEMIFGRPFLDLAEPDDHEVVENGLSRLSTGETITGIVTRLRGVDGEVRSIMWDAIPDGDVFHMVGRDLTEQLDAEERLRQSQKMEAVGQLTGGLAHDFNNLLAGISGSLELMALRLGQDRTADVDKYIAAAQGAARRAAALTHRLLAFSRRQTLDPKPTDVDALVADMRELVERTIGPAITLEVANADQPWTVLIDPPQLENALLNLCINARDAMSDGGRIAIATSNERLDAAAATRLDLAEGDYVLLCVADTGTGMPPEVIAKAFDPFYTTKPIGQGTGLGLSMIYGFAKQSGGQVVIQSEVGVGTRVCLYLPRHAGVEVVEATRAAAPAPVRAQRGEAVLVVDDEPTIRMLIAETLDELGYVAIEAADSIAGLRILESDIAIDLLVSDIGLPGGMNGRQMAEEARRSRPDLRVLFVTGYAENALLGAGELTQGMAVLTKPFAVTALGARVRELLSDR